MVDGRIGRDGFGDGWFVLGNGFPDRTGRDEFAAGLGAGGVGEAFSDEELHGVALDGVVQAEGLCDVGVVPVVAPDNVSELWWSDDGGMGVVCEGVEDDFAECQPAVRGDKVPYGPEHWPRDANGTDHGGEPRLCQAAAPDLGPVPFVALAAVHLVGRREHACGRELVVHLVHRICFGHEDIFLDHPQVVEFGHEGRVVAAAAEVVQGLAS